MTQITPDQLASAILREMTFEPTPDQHNAVTRLAHFCCQPSEHKAFILRGYAGTGKTTLVSALIRTLRHLNQPTILLAPTGRAAKVLATYAGQSAHSIHRIIYRQKTAGSTEFDLNYNPHRHTIFIIDEASMIANAPTDGITFGTGRLLDDLIHYIYTADGCSMILIGDTAQLLPIGHTTTPALDPLTISHYGLTTTEAHLTSVLRHTAQSGILHNATLLRHAIDTTPFRPVTLATGYPDLHLITGETLIDDIQNSYATVGEENTIILTHSNRRALLYNRGIRTSVLYREDELTAGDLLLVTRNNYYWSAPYDQLDFIANGDIARILRLSRHTDLYGLRFADLTLQLIDYDIEITARILIDSLYTDTPQSADALNSRLTAAIAEDYPHITDRRTLWREMQNNPYYNALQVKFAYAITGHKAQGGSWQHVYIDQGYITPDTITRQYYQWLYTAITRARTHLYLVNFHPTHFTPT